MPSLRVRIFDDDLGQIAKSEPPVRLFVKALGYELDLKTACLNADALTEDLITDRPDLIFLDNHFGTKHPNHGAQYISQYKPSYPDCIFVLMTREQLSISQFAVSFPHPDMIVAKASLQASGKNQGYFEFVCKTLDALIHRSRIAAFNIEPNAKAAMAKLKNKFGQRLRKRKWSP